MSVNASTLPIFVKRAFRSPLQGRHVRGAVSSRPPARASVRILRRARRRAPRSAVAGRANRSAARPDARAFRGINGRLPAVALLQSPRFTQRRRAPSIYSTEPLHPRFIAALSASHGDRRMRGRKQLDSAPDAEGSTATEYQLAAPSEIGAGGWAESTPGSRFGRAPSARISRRGRPFTSCCRASSTRRLFAV
jgi:hypothetical protein